MNIVIIKIDDSLEKLRKEWKNTPETDRETRRLIEARARALKNAREMHVKNGK